MRGWGLWVVSLMAGCASSPRAVTASDAPVAPVPSAPESRIREIQKAPSGFAADDLLPCTNATDLAAARQQLNDLSVHIIGLADGDDAKSATAELEALFKTKCFELASADRADPLTFDSGLSLRTWWELGGGEEWLGNYLLGREMQMLITPASPRPTLFREGHETAAFAPLLCPAADGACGSDTNGWQLRAEKAFGRAHAPEPFSCFQEANRVDFTARWAKLVSCRQSQLPPRPVMPLGRFKAPTDGLLVSREGVNGRCPSVYVYDLASGTEVRFRCNTPLEVGKVSLAAIREAAWMLVLQEQSVFGKHDRDEVDLADGVIAGRLRSTITGRSGGFGFGSTTSNRWHWYRSSAKGAFAEQMAGDAARGVPGARAHAEELLAVAEASFVAGCVPGWPAFAKVPWPATGPLETALETAISAAKSPARCPATP